MVATMSWNRPGPVLAGTALALLLALSSEASAQKTTTVNVVNDPSHPVPVAVQDKSQVISFHEGFRVPDGKRLLIDDVSVACTTVGTTLADFRTFGLAASALLHITYPPANCPEPLDSEGECHQLYAVGTARQTGIEPIFVTAAPDSRPAARLWAGRQLSAVADQGATILGACDGIQVNFPPGFTFTVSGTGRLMDRP